MTFLRKYFSNTDLCIVANIIKDTAYFAVPVLLFGILTLVFVTDYVATIIILQKRTREREHLTNTINTSVMDLNSRLTRATMIALGTYVMLYLPGVAITCIDIFVDSHYLFIIQDILLILYFCNNIVNPFIYSFTLKDFREGYKKLLQCKKCSTG